MQSSLKKEPAVFSLLCWNIANPSVERAGKQALWLKQRPEDILLLTEAKHSKGCIFLERYLQAFGYNVVFPKPEEEEYGVMAVSKNKLKPTDFSKLIKYLPSRVVSVESNRLEIIGVYAPSRGFDEGERLVKKKRFLEGLSNALDKSGSPTRRIFCGDLNVLEPNHIPYYDYFKNWEYDFYRDLAKHQLIDVFRDLHPDTEEHSWFGRSGAGYRYDHSFVSDDLKSAVKECYYLHEPRETKLSDHSAMVLKLIL
ncbi:MAG: endonuclease/exonuclease/phosphatase family protein [bacterium]